MIYVFIYAIYFFLPIQVSTNIIFFAVKTKEGIKMETYKVQINICADCSQSNLWLSNNTNLKKYDSIINTITTTNDNDNKQDFPFLFAKDFHAKEKKRHLRWQNEIAGQAHEWGAAGSVSACARTHTSKHEPLVFLSFFFFLNPANILTGSVWAPVQPSCLSSMCVCVHVFFFFFNMWAQVGVRFIVNT